VNVIASLTSGEARRPIREATRGRVLNIELIKNLILIINIEINK